MEFTREDFTEEELILLRLAFSLLNNAVNGTKELCWVDYSNAVYSIKDKLGIYDLLEE